MKRSALAFWIIVAIALLCWPLALFAESDGSLTGVTSTPGTPARVVSATAWASPGTIGSTTPNTGAFTTLSTTTTASIGTTLSTVNGDITENNTGGFSSLNLKGTTGNGGVVNFFANGVNENEMVGTASNLYIRDNVNSWIPWQYNMGAIAAGTVAFNGTLEASAPGTASVALVGGFGVAKRSFLGTIGATFVGNVLAGVQSGASAVSGQVGELLSNGQSTYTNFTTTATYQQLATVSVTPGDWHWVATVTLSANSATLTTASNAIFAFSNTTASAAGSVEGLSLVYIDQNVLGSSKQTVNFEGDLNQSTTTSWFLNGQAAFTVGNPQYVCNLAFRRVR